MAALVLPSRRVVQPQQAAGVDWSNPLSSGLVLDAGANTALRDAVTNRSPSWTAGSPEYASNKYGRSVNFASDVASFGDVELFPSATATLLIVDKPVNLTQAAGLVNKRLSASSQHSFSIGYNYNSSSELCVDIGAETGSTVAISYRFSLSKFSTNGNIIFVVIDVAAGSGAKVRLFVNGVEETSKTVGIDTVLSAIPNTTAPFEIGRVNNGTIYYTGHINRVAAWSRALSGAEVAAMSANPWQIFRPLNRSVYLLPADSGGGSQNITQSTQSDNAQTFYSGTITTSRTVGQDTRLDNAQTFYGGTVIQSGAAQSVTQDTRFDNAQAFYGGAVVPDQSVTQDTRLDNSQTFYGGAVTSIRDITQATRFDNAQTFYGGIVVPDQPIIQTSRFNNSQVFYFGEVSGGAVVAVNDALVPPLRRRRR